MTKLHFKIAIIALSFWINASFSNPVNHAHGDRVHSHKLPIAQGVFHTHGTLPKGKLLPSQKEPPKPQKPLPVVENTDVHNQSPNSAKTTSNEHIHGHLSHVHPLPSTGVKHQHGKGVPGRRFVKVSEFNFKKSVWATDSRIRACGLVFLSKGLSPKFNPYRDWSGYCNDIKDTKEFKIKVYENYSGNGLFAYDGFERDYARLLNMRADDYKQVQTSSIPKSTYSGSSGRSVFVRGYYRKNGTYVRSHTRRRRR